MEFLLLLVIAVVLFGSGYAFRGLINREIKAVAADLKAELAAIKSKL